MTNRPIVITGCQRSGTTLLGLILDSHPAITTIDEAAFDGEQISTYLTDQRYAPNVAWKLPAQSHRVDELSTLPGASVLWVQRDPRDVVASMMDLQLSLRERTVCWASHPLGGPRELDAVLPKLGLAGITLPPAVLADLNTVAGRDPTIRTRRDAVTVAAVCWAAKQRWCEHLLDRGISMRIVRYEELVQNPERYLQQLLQELSIDWSEQVLIHHQLHQGWSIGQTDNSRPIDRQSVDRWRRDLDDEEVDLLQSLLEMSWSEKATTNPAHSTKRSVPSPAADLRITTSRMLIAWLRDQRVSLAFAARRANKVFWIGIAPDGRLSVNERTIEAPTALAADGADLWISSAFQLWRFRNALPAGEHHNEHDRVYLPRHSFVTGDLSVSDLALDRDGVIMAAGRFNCLARPDIDHNFRPIWHPAWMDELAAENRCGLSGVGVRDGVVRYAALATQGEDADWIADPRRRGAVIDIANDQTVIDGLTLPHAPRWHNGRLYALDAGAGRLIQAGQHGDPEEVCIVPGMARALACTGPFAVIGYGTSTTGQNGLPLPIADTLEKRAAKARCGLSIVDLATGAAPHWVRIEGPIHDIDSVAALPDTVRPMAIGFVGDDVRKMVSFQ